MSVRGAADKICEEIQPARHPSESRDPFLLDGKITMGPGFRRDDELKMVEITLPA
ncbi:hypothetical protein [Arenimonas sp.]|uniref:hypothetical protein n=1 Tax=Arenimonas sp. TaxID=1872635 RepID=UPI002D1FB733|nr:hypothetical protein [Arenimonas sp.]